MLSQGRVPNHEAAVAKTFCTSLEQRITDTVSQIYGAAASLDASDPHAPLAGRAARTFLYAAAYTIQGGTNNILRNIIATRGLGLPDDPGRSSGSRIDRSPSERYLRTSDSTNRRMARALGRALASAADATPSSSVRRPRPYDPTPVVDRKTFWLFGCFPKQDIDVSRDLSRRRQRDRGGDQLHRRSPHRGHARDLHAPHDLVLLPASAGGRAVMRRAVAASLVLLLSSGCYRTLYRNLQPRNAPPVVEDDEHDPQEAARRLAELLHVRLVPDRATDRRLPGVRRRTRRDGRDRSRPSARARSPTP